MMHILPAAPHGTTDQMSPDHAAVPRATSSRSVLAVSGSGGGSFGVCLPIQRVSSCVGGWEGGGVAASRYHPSVTAIAAVLGAPPTPMLRLMVKFGAGCPNFWR